MMATALLALMASPALAKTHRTCEARIAAAQQDWPADPAPQPPVFANTTSEADRAVLTARYERLKSQYNPHAMRDYTIQMQQEHECHGLHAYMSEPADRTITITGTIYHDGTVLMEAQ